MKDRKINSKIDKKYEGGKKSFMGPKQSGRVKRVIIAGLFLLIAALLMAQHSFAAPITFKAVLSGPAEAPPNTSPGTGNATAITDTAAHTLDVSAAFSGLLGNTSAAHIHCCTATPFEGAAGVATQTPSFAGFPLGVTSGSFSNTFDLTLASSWNPAFITANGGTPSSAEAVLFAGLLEGRAYFNIHSASFPGGEIRGFLIPVINNLVSFAPIPSSFQTTSDVTGCPAGFVGKFGFDAMLTNKSNSQLSDLLVNVAALSNGNLLQNADGGPDGVGALMTVPLKNGYSDGILSKNEFADVPFIICLKQKKAFSFFVDVLGIAE